jgi:hypothetical protein
MFRIRRPNRRRILAAGRRGRLAAGIALIATVAVLIVVVLDARSTTSPPSTSNSASASGSTTVQRRDLVETDTESGTLGYADPGTVFDHVSGTITWLPHVGQLIKPGQPLFDASQQPVILLNGTTPAYRDLGPSDTAGQDTLQLNRNLVALGFNPDGIVVDDTWQAATTVGLDLLQSSLGETEAGRLSLGQIVFLPGAQLVSNVEATLGDGGGSGTGAAGTSTHPPAARTEFIGLTTTTTTPTTTAKASTRPKPTERVTAQKPSLFTNSQTLASLTALLRAEAAQLKAATAALKAAKAAPSSSRSSSSKPSAGSSGATPSASSSSSNGGGSGAAVLQTSSTQLTATVDLDASKQSEARVGERVTVEMPAGNTVKGVITAVSSVAQSSSSSANGASPSGASGNDNGGSASSGATIPVTIKLKGHVGGAGLDQAAVSVNFTQAFANNVLSVPVTALLARTGGGYAVQEAAAPHQLIPVTTGLFAAGYVEISGQRIYPGLPVTNSQG